MKILKFDISIIKPLLKIGILFSVFYTVTDIASFIFNKIYDVIIQNQNPQLVVDSDEYIKYLEEQFSNISTFPAMSLILIQCTTMILCVILFWKFGEKKRLRDIGLTSINSSWSDLVFGLLIGAMSFTLVAFILLCTKSVVLQNGFDKPNFSHALIIQLIIFIFVGISEELFSRGHCMNVLKQTQKSWSTPIMVSSIIFALMHFMNEGISLLAYINLFLFGVFMGYIYIRTKNLWMCIGYHIAWNYFQGSVFGFLVSGVRTDSIYIIEVIDPNILNGGNFGPEGGLIATILLIISIFITYKFLPAR